MSVGTFSLPVIARFSLVTEKPFSFSASSQIAFLFSSSSLLPEPWEIPSTFQYSGLTVGRLLRTCKIFSLLLICFSLSDLPGIGNSVSALFLRIWSAQVKILCIMRKIGVTVLCSVSMPQNIFPPSISGYHPYSLFPFLPIWVETLMKQDLFVLPTGLHWVPSIVAAIYCVL